MSLSSAMAVSSGTMPSGVAAAQRAGGDLHHSRRTGWRNQTVDHRLMLAEQRAAGGHAGEDLVNMLRLHREKFH